ncbi:hypothetical protein AB0D04_14880 [Streptomyces sp. NPDC048483]|uniref:hypothetical protein n=1 Tax=Streptomyces sp. NPDC048483 TaxID=3154927 RepID=UPI00342630EC
MDAHEIRDRINLSRCYIAALSDLVWSAAEVRDATTLRYYADKRQQAAQDLKARTICGQRDGLLTDEDAESALSPMSGLEDALVFTD